VAKGGLARDHDVVIIMKLLSSEIHFIKNLSRSIDEGVFMRRLESGTGSGNLRAGVYASLTHGRRREKPSRDR
jgi:hypothetical protein